MEISVNKISLSGEVKELLMSIQMGPNFLAPSRCSFWMTDARCKRCTEKKVRLMEIIQAGHGDRYQLECIACGNTWYASRDEAASLTIDGPNFTKSVGTEPLATAKFEDVEKNLTSPRRVDKGASDVLKEAYMPVLDSQRSFNKSRTEDNTTTSNAD